MTRRYLGYAGIAVAAALGIWLLFVALPRWWGPRRAADTAADGARAGDARRIKATLFYVADDGLRLVGMEREVPYGADAEEQARRIVEEQIRPVAAPLFSAIPKGTALRGVYVTDKGEAYVDLSAEVTRAHPGGSLEELFTVYALVNALTVNLPAITGVQLLVDGREVDTLAGHIDVRQPLRKSLAWIEAPAAPSQASP